MIAPVSEGAGRATEPGRVTGSPASAPPITPVVGVVGGVTLTGLLSFAATVEAGRRLGPDGPLIELGWLGGWPLVAVLVSLTCGSELVAVRLRHGDTVEELTLLDSTVLLNVLLLPPNRAVGVSLLGLAAAYAIRRRALVKSLFNIGTYATAASVLTLVLRLLGEPTAHFDLRLIVATTAGAAGFVAVNVTCMSLLLTSLGAGSFRDVVRQDIRLSLFTLAATTAMSATVVAIAVHTPAFLPFTALPAAAITYAYRAAATEAEERQRSAHVLAFSRVLAGSPGRDVAIARFLHLAREGFFADHAAAVFLGGEVLTMCGTSEREPADADPEPGTEGPGDGAAGLVVSEPGFADDVHRRFVDACTDGAAMLDDDLPAGWHQAMVAPLAADGAVVGAVAVGWSGSDRRRCQDLTMFASLASSLAVALSRAQHLARLVEETSKLRAVVDQSSDGILVLDGSGRVMVWNPALQALSGRREDEAVGRFLGDLLDARDEEGRVVDAFAMGCRMMSASDPQVTVELQIVRPDEERRSVRWAHAGSFDDDGLLVRDVVNVHDLTRERQADRLKSDFIATVSHELRTPVTPIKGYAELLRKRWDSLPDDKRRKALDVISDRAGHLGRLVEDLLLASSISTAREPERSIVVGTADLNTLVTRAAEDFVQARSRLRIRGAPEPVEVVCDTTRTVQILTNLLSNGLKYSPEDQAVEIEVQRFGDLGTVTVLDHGRGIASDQLDKVFEKFHRVEDPMVMTTGGSGLGLYIARHLARAMGGEIEVTSTLGEGSAFRLRLRSAPPGQPGEATGPPGTGLTHRGRAP